MMTKAAAAVVAALAVLLPAAPALAAPSAPPSPTNSATAPASDPSASTPPSAGDPASTDPASTDPASGGAAGDPVATTGTDAGSPPAGTADSTRVLQVRGTIGAVSGQQRGTLQVDIPPGFVPVKATATSTPQTVSKGDALVYAGDRETADVKTDKTRATSFALTADDVVDGVLTLGLEYRLPADTTTVCVSTATDLVTLSDIAVTLEGRAAPVTDVADFFSDTVSSVSVIIPDDPTSAERGAGLAAVDAVAMRYSLPVVVTLTTRSDAAHRPVADPVFGRIIRITQSTSYITTSFSDPDDGPPELTIDGRADELLGAARGLSSQFLKLADDQTVEGPFTTLDPRKTLSLTLADLGSDTVELQGYGRAEASIGIRQSRFGTSVDQVDVKLSGTHSAIDSKISASVQLFWDDQLVASKMLDAHDRFDMGFTLGKAYVQASNTLRIQLNSVPAGGKCVSAASPIIPLELSINGKASTISATGGQGLPAGFQRFPQALDGHLDVAFGTQGTPAQLTAAAGNLVVALQRNSPQQLVVGAISMTRALASGDPCVIVGASADDARHFAAPLRFSEFKSVSGTSGGFAVGVAQPFAAFEAFESGGRDVLMLGGYSPDPATTDDVTAGMELALADQVANGQFGWDGLYDDLLVTTRPDAEGQIFQSQAVVPQTARTQDYRSMAVWIGAALAVAVGLVVAGNLGLRARRRRVKRIVDAQEAAVAQALAEREHGGV